VELVHLGASAPVVPTVPQPFGRLGTVTVRAWHAGLIENGPGASSAAKCYRLLRSILNTAVEDGLIAVNPCCIKGAGVEPADERPLPSLAEVYAGR
jgi:hypothetical protein